jgi:aminoglycoside 2'-N-acetyltransferase I
MPETLIIETLSRSQLTTATYDEIVALCTRAYEEPFGEIMAEFTEATHVMARERERLVSHALWVPRTLYTADRALRSAYVEAVATEPAHQGRGYASSVMRALAGEIVHYELGALSHSDAAFYERFGWERWTGPRAVHMTDGDQPTPDEEVMILRLAGTLALDTTGPLAATWRAGDVW